jgi:hypothetical protein
VTDNEKAQHRNEVIEEMCVWLEGCIAQVDHNSETFLSCTAMVRGLRNKKTAVAPEPEKLEGEHYPLTRTGIRRQ